MTITSDQLTSIVINVAAYGGLMAAVFYSSFRQERLRQKIKEESDAKRDSAAAEVKASLIQNHAQTDKKLEVIRTQGNSLLGASLLSAASVAKRLAEITKDPLDLAMYNEARRRYEEHQRGQEEINKGNL